MYTTCKTTWTHFLIICFIISSSSYDINRDRGFVDLGLGIPGLGLALVLGDMVLITFLCIKGLLGVLQQPGLQIWGSTIGGIEKSSFAG